MPRKALSIRGIVLIAFGGLVGLSLAACTPPMPPDVMAAVAESQIDCQSGDVSVSVPDDLFGSMGAVGMALNGVCPEQTVTEVGAVEPAPVKLTGGTPTPSDIDAFKQESCPSGEAITIPAFSYPITLAYNVPGLEGLYFTPEAVAGVLNGTVTSFEDPLIAGPNEGFDLTGLPPITVMSVATPQPAVQAMTAWLAKSAPDQWTASETGTLSVGSTFDSVQALLDEMSFTEASIAVLPNYQAISYALATASLPTYPVDEAGAAGEAVYTLADDPQLTKVGSGATTVSTTETGSLIASPAIGGIPSPENFDLAASKIVLAEGQPMAGWPVMAYAHLLVCDVPGDPLPLAFAQYLIRLAGQGSLETFGVTPLPEPIRLDTFKPLKVTVNTDAPMPTIEPDAPSS